MSDWRSGQELAVIPDMTKKQPRRGRKPIPEKERKDQLVQTRVPGELSQTLRDAAKRIEKAVREGVETVRAQSGPYRDNATQQIDEAQKYVVERIKERPVVATLAGLGVGLLLGLMMASRSDK